MALTGFQQAICRLIAANRLEQGEAYVARGVALNLLTGGRRISRDIDLFHDTLEALDATWRADRKLLESHVYELRSIHERAGYVEAVVGRGPDTVLVQWTRDSAFRFFPLVEHEELGLVHDRLRRLKRELDRECYKLLVRVVWRHRPRVICFEECLGPGHSMTTRGTRGALAKAITHMPKRLAPILEAALRVLEERGVSVELVTVPAKVKSHRGCGGRLKPVPGNWDVFRCNLCGELMNRHHYTAREYSLRALSACQGLPATPRGVAERQV